MLLLLLLLLRSVVDDDWLALREGDLPPQLDLDVLARGRSRGRSLRLRPTCRSFCHPALAPADAQAPGRLCRTLLGGVLPREVRLAGCHRPLLLPLQRRRRRLRADPGRPGGRLVGGQHGGQAGVVTAVVGAIGRHADGGGTRAADAGVGGVAGDTVSPGQSHPSASGAGAGACAAVVRPVAGVVGRVGVEDGAAPLVGGSQVRGEVRSIRAAVPASVSMGRVC